MSQSSLQSISQEEVEVATSIKKPSNRNVATKRTRGGELDIETTKQSSFTPTQPFSPVDINHISTNNFTSLNKKHITELILAMHSSVKFLNALPLESLMSFKNIKHYMNKIDTVPVLEKCHEEIVAHIVPLLLIDDSKASTKKRKTTPQPKEHKNIEGATSTTSQNQFQLKDLKKVNGSKLLIDKDENVALFHMDDNQLSYVGKGVCVGDSDDENLVVEITQLEMNFSSEFKLLTEYDWPKVNLCKFIHYSPTKLSVSEIKQKKNNFTMRDLECNVSETTRKEMEQLRSQLANSEVELKKTKAALNEANTRIEQLENAASINCEHEENMQKVWNAIDELEKARKKVMKYGRKVTIFWGDDPDGFVVLTDTEAAELSLNQPTRAIVRLITLLSEKFDAFDLNLKYIMPGDNTKYSDVRVKLTKGTIDKLIISIRKCIPCLALKTVHVSEIKEQIASAFKQLRKKADEELNDE